MKKFLFIGFVFILSGKLDAQSVEGLERTEKQYNEQQQLRTGQIQQPVQTFVKEEDGDFGESYVLNSKTTNKKQWVEGQLDHQSFYTSNASADSSNEKNDWEMVSTAEILFTPPLSETFIPKIGFRHQFFNFIDNSDLDFDSQTVFTSVEWKFADKWSAELGYNWTRLLSAENGRAEFFKEQVSSLSLTRYFEISPKIMLMASYDANARFTSPQIFSRDEHGITLAYSQMLTAHLVWQSFYRFQYADYFCNSDRNDFTHITGTALTYYFNSWASAGVHMSYVSNETDQGDFSDYEVWNGGVGLNATIRF